MEKTVTKRSGDIVEFDIHKIDKAINRANKETNEMTYEKIVEITNKVVDGIEDSNIHVEEIQDLV